MNNTQTLFHPGDLVIHTIRPEWGEGVVEQVTPVTANNQNAQRLVVRFAHKGIVTLNTAIANVLSKRNTSAMSSPNSLQSSTFTEPQNDPFALKTEIERPLWQLPESMTDPFAGSGKRLHATLDSYRFGADPRGVLEWAIAQSGLNDPMTRYNRHELEQAYDRFTQQREAHLIELVQAMKKQGKTDLLNQVLQDTTHPAARTALQKAMRR